MKIEGVVMKSPPALSKHAALCLFAGMLLLHPSVSGAEFYKYKDSSGAVVITNKLADVPKKYRGQLKIVWDEELEAKDPLARRRAEAERLREQRESQQEKRKPLDKSKKNNGKTLVITFDEETGQLIRTFE